MSFLDYMKNKKETQPVQESNTKKTDAEYFNEVNPKTGKRYDIPLLSPVSPGYKYEYIYYMKLKESSPETFEKLLRWE